MGRITPRSSAPMEAYMGVASPRKKKMLEGLMPGTMMPSPHRTPHRHHQPKFGITLACPPRDKGNHPGEHHHQRNRQRGHRTAGHALLPRLAKQAGQRAHDQADKQEDGRRFGPLQKIAQKLGDAKRSHQHAHGDGPEETDLLFELMDGVGQKGHHRLVDAHDNAQRAAADARQPRANSDDSALENPQQGALAGSILQCKHILSYA